ncbi:MAG: ABC transporter ATP-binding protein [Myxococcota bacterium]
MIEARGLTKRYGRFTAVDAVDLDVQSQGIVGFLGPNGAGKTTTMRMLTGFLPMTSGTAKVAGFDVFDQPLQVKARVGYLPETPPLYPELKVGEYLSFVGEIRGLSRSERLKRVGDVMDQVGLREMEKRLTGALSKGYRQRVGLAQALLHDPPVLILDEPTSGLDPAQLVGIRSLVRDLARERVVVLSTHILQEVELLCDRVILIHRGKIAGDGTVDSLAQAAGAGPWVEFIASGPNEQSTASLAELAAVSSVSILESSTPNTMRFRLEGSADLVASVASLAAAQGWAVHGLSPRAASLEDVFLALVREGS